MIPSSKKTTGFNSYPMLEYLYGDAPNPMREMYPEIKYKKKKKKVKA